MAKSSAFLSEQQGNNIFDKWKAFSQNIYDLFQASQSPGSNIYVIRQNNLSKTSFMQEDLKNWVFKESAINVSGNLKLDVEPSYDIEDHLEKKLDKLFHKRKTIVLGRHIQRRSFF